jgi:hypothetical protein
MNSKLITCTCATALITFHRQGGKPQLAALTMRMQSRSVVFNTEASYHGGVQMWLDSEYNMPFPAEADIRRQKLAANAKRDGGWVKRKAVREIAHLAWGHLNRRPYLGSSGPDRIAKPS